MMHTGELTKISTLDLVHMLADRQDLADLLDKNGRAQGKLYEILTRVVPITFVEGFAAKKEKDGARFMMGVLQDMAGKYRLISGKNGQEQTYEQTLFNQWKLDVNLRVSLVAGLSWREPLDCFQYMKDKDPVVQASGIGQDRGKNSRSHVYAVVLASSEAEIRYGKKVSKFQWINPLESKYEQWANKGMADSAIFSWNKLVAGLNKGQYKI